MNGPYANAACDLIVYTCVTDRYDTALMTAPAETATRFVCFADQPSRIVAPGWDLEPLQSPPSLTRGHDINRFHKFFAHHLFPTARWSIYIDGNVRFDGSFEALVDRVCKANAEIGAFWHPHAHSLRKEAEVCALSKFDEWDYAQVEKQLRVYEAGGIDLDAPIPACYVLVRDHASERLDHAMSLWWTHIFTYTKRDQMSFSWVLSKTGLKFQALDGKDGIDPALIQRENHARPPLWKRVIRRLV